MKKLILLIIITSPFLRSYSQVPPDSLPGHYVGEYWFRVENDPWTIRIDTVWVTEINAEDCFMHLYSWDDAYWSTYFNTLYDYCYANPENLFEQFYAQDSLRIIYDNISLPPPDPIAVSYRFYGKKTYVPVGICNNVSKSYMIVFPIPAKDYIYLPDHHNFKKYFIHSMLGDLVQSGTVNKNMKIDISRLKSGMYLLKCQYEKSIYTSKILKQ